MEGWDATTWASIWATVALVIFLGIVIYMGVPKQIAAMLDARINKVKDDLAAAARLRSEAEALLVEYEAKRKSAEAEAAGIVAAAQAEAKRLAEEAQTSLSDLITRRTKAVEQKIAQAEAQALAEVRARSADIAVEAARLILERQMPERGAGLLDQAIRDVGTRLN
jgi:F-type H+-transporting ATPase subunit b